MDRDTETRLQRLRDEAAVHIGQSSPAVIQVLPSLQQRWLPCLPAKAIFHWLCLLKGLVVGGVHCNLLVS